MDQVNHSRKLNQTMQQSENISATHRQDVNFVGRAKNHSVSDQHHSVKMWTTAFSQTQQQVVASQYYPQAQFQHGSVMHLQESHQQQQFQNSHANSIQAGQYQYYPQAMLMMHTQHQQLMQCESAPSTSLNHQQIANLSVAVDNTVPVLPETQSQMRPGYIAPQQSPMQKQIAVRFDQHAGTSAQNHQANLLPVGNQQQQSLQTAYAPLQVQANQTPQNNQQTINTNNAQADAPQQHPDAPSTLFNHPQGRSDQEPPVGRANQGGAVPICTKIEQALDLVKSHLQIVVRDEVEALQKELAVATARERRLKFENAMLKASIPLQRLSEIAQTVKQPGRFPMTRKAHRPRN